jgi:signal peptidase I
MSNKTKQAPKKPRPREHPLELLSSYSRLFIGYFFVFTFVIGWFEIPSSSMENTLLIGDHVLVNREQFAPPTNFLHAIMPYGQVQRGDVVVFLSPAQPELYLVKRIVGIPGDRIHLREGAVYRNGEKLSEHYVIHTGDPYPYRDEFPAVPPPDFDESITDTWRIELSQRIENGDIVVPANSYFAMGDNRDVSRDSRYFGFVPKENIIGRPMVIYWSFESSESDYLQTGMSNRLRGFAKTVIHFFDRTRWRRSFQVIR